MRVGWTQKEITLFLLGSSTWMHMSIVSSTMADRAADEIGMVNLFPQLVPSPAGRYENDIDRNALGPDSLRFNGGSYKAQLTYIQL